MERGQFDDMSANLPGYKKLWFKWTMTGTTTFTINRSQELLAGTLGITRTGTGIFNIFPASPPGVELIDWWFGVIAATPGPTMAGSALESVVDNLAASGKVTVTFRSATAGAAADFASADVVRGYIGIQTVYMP